MGSKHQETDEKMKAQGHRPSEIEMKHKALRVFYNLLK